MPPKFKFTRAEMTAAALDVTREKGIAGLTARSLASRLGCSVKPIFGLFENMEEVQREVIATANSLYLERISREIAAEKYPPYKASGIAYIGFAREERELFKLLFMRDRSGEKMEDNREPVQPQIDQIRKATGLGEEEAYRFHIEMWIYVHGIATMIATSYLDWDMEFIEQTLTDEYIGLKYRFCQAGDQKGVTNGSYQDKPSHKKI
ncbi:MAG: TetR/AcrR family transcriptional regulator [Roseburia sp.]|nr:TetR/AcrR family transcriptional regulator [Roseburia sp.]MCM1097399.1 TetR/AcrR family transcriptional regulator [Ruminococcus flavefaciens]